jgi:carboxymethylenebutenolidase
MCDEDSFDDMLAYRLRTGLLTRRHFGAVSVGAGIASVLPIGCKGTDRASGPTATTTASAAPIALATTESEVTIAMTDGFCDAYFVRPALPSAPGVLIWPDIFGLRPAFQQMGKRLAEAGYVVLVANPFYRLKKAPTTPAGGDIDDPATRETLMGMARTLTPENEVTDARALVAWLDQQPYVDKARKMATVGYCMGGPLVMRTAAAIPERIGAAATFHGGGLVTDKPDSPHLLIPKMKETLKTAFREAGLGAKVEVFEGTKHGWCPPDSHAYDREAAERAWGEMIALFREALG